MANPHVLSWINPTLNTDGSAMAQPDFAGYELSLDGAPSVSVPLQFGVTFDMATLAAYQALKTGAHTATLAVVNTAGNVGAPSTAASFQLSPTPGIISNLAVK